VMYVLSWDFKLESASLHRVASGTSKKVGWLQVQKVHNSNWYNACGPGADGSAYYFVPFDGWQFSQDCSSLIGNLLNNKYYSLGDCLISYTVFSIPSNFADDSVIEITGPTTPFELPGAGETNWRMAVWAFFSDNQIKTVYITRTIVVEGPLWGWRRITRTHSYDIDGAVFCDGLLYTSSYRPERFGEYDYRLTRWDTFLVPNYDRSSVAVHTGAMLDFARAPLPPVCSGSSRVISSDGLIDVEFDMSGVYNAVIASGAFTEINASSAAKVALRDSFQAGWACQDPDRTFDRLVSFNDADDSSETGVFAAKWSLGRFIQYVSTEECNVIYIATDSGNDRVITPDGVTAVDFVDAKALVAGVVQG